MLWPGLSGHVTNTSTPFAEVRGQWADTIEDLAQKQRALVNQQFDLTRKAIDLTFGATEKTAAPSVKAEASPSKATEAVREAASTKLAVPAPTAQSPVRIESGRPYISGTQNIVQKVAVVTGAASGIGEAVARELAHRGAKTVMLVDRSEQVLALASSINEAEGRQVAIGQVGDTTDAAFRKRVFNQAAERHDIVSICVPAAGITRDALAVKIDKETGKAELYPVETFRQVTEVNLIAPIYWAIEMIARIAEDRHARGLKRWEPEEKIQGAVVFLGSVSSQGNKGQISYAVAKAGLEGAAATLMKEAIFHGVRCGVIHPGFTDTPMAKALGKDFLDKYVLPYTQLRRLIRPEEIADAICFMISNSAVSGELWADAGWHPPA
ncbi:MAG: SDR family oxidoreductase [Planctomycetia bacterium]|nr:SDR family oxidoreductase [Planctomycetia bacterium]